MTARPTNRELLERILAEVQALRDTVVMNDMVDAMARAEVEHELDKRSSGRRHRTRPAGERPGHLKLATGGAP